MWSREQLQDGLSSKKNCKISRKSCRTPRLDCLIILVCRIRYLKLMQAPVWSIILERTSNNYSQNFKNNNSCIRRMKVLEYLQPKKATFRLHLIKNITQMVNKSKNVSKILLILPFKPQEELKSHGSKGFPNYIRISFKRLDLVSIGIIRFIWNRMTQAIYKVFDTKIQQIRPL